MRGLSVVLGVMAAVMFVSPQLWAKTFYMKNGDEIEPGKAKEMVAGLMQAMTAKSYTVTGCTPSSDGRSATLALKGKIDFMGKDTDSDGTVSFVREGNGWKIDKVAWNAKW